MKAMESEQIKVLLIEDNAGDARLIRQMLNGSGGIAFAVACAGRLSEGLEELKGQGADIVLLDLSLPDSRGMETLHAVQQGSDVPVVVLTGLDDTDLALDSVRAGAQDYLVKGEVSEELLVRSIRYAIERRRTEAALRESEEKFRVLAEQSPNMIFIYCQERVQYANRKCEEVSGHTQEELCSPDFDFRGLIAPEHREQVEEKRCRHMTGEEVEPFEYQLVTKSGERVDALLATRHITYRGQPAMLGTVTDITERKRVEGALSEAVKHWEETFDAIEDMVIIIDRDFRIIRANRAALEAFGGRAVVGKRCYEVLHGRSEPPEQCPTSTAFETGEATHSEILEPKMGDRWLDLFAYPVRDDDGETQQIVHVACDITERKLAEQELSSQRQFSNAIVDTAGALIVVLDPEGRIVRFNRACEKTTGYAASEVEGRPVWEVLIPPEERHEVRRVFGGLVEDISFSTHENHWLTKDGERRRISWANTRVLDPGGELQWVIGTGIDVTEQRQLEDRLARAAKLEAVGQLAGGIAHDFNNLLTAILGYVDLNLAEVPAGSQFHDDLVQVRNAAKRASDLTRQLLTFSRRQVGRPEIVDLNDTVRDVYRMLRHLIEENVEIELVLSSDPLKVKADPAQLGQVLMNLAVNARDAMPEGGLLRIATSVAEFDRHYAAAHPEVKPGRYAELSVSDSGTGIPGDIRGRVFDPFFSTKQVGQGTGLGLSTVYGIVKQHGGRVEFHSELGVGTTFRIHLPLAEAETVAKQDSTAFGITFQGRERVLLAEDEEDVRTLAARVLEECGYEVLAASDGLDALTMLREHGDGIDLLITDIVMPNMDGPELAQKVRMMQPEAKLLFISGYASQVEAARDAEVPGVPVLQKPFTAHGLAAEVRSVLDAY
jgi:PAS domain S-box-containing protein